MSARAAALAVLLASLAPAGVSAQDVSYCPDAVVEWAEECAGPAPVRATACPVGRAIFTVGALRVEVSRDPAHAFVAAGELGASPIGEFPDWSAAPAADRAAFDALVQCLRERPAELAAALREDPPPARLDAPRAPARPGAPIPWRLLGGLGLFVGLSVRRFGARGLLRRAAPPLGLALVTFVARRIVVPERFFHQNGHGATWVEYALGRATPYGPGYEELLGAARLFADPDAGVIGLVGLAMALVPAAVFAMARGLAVPKPLAWVAALAVAVSPFEARLSASESYFAAQSALHALAAAGLALGAPPEARRLDRILAALAAGLVVAQAARLHPIGWLAAALVPGVLVVAPGATAERLARAALAALVIGAVVLVTSGPAMLAVLEGELGAAWLGPARSADHRPWPIWVIAALVLAAATLAVRRPQRQRLARSLGLVALTAAVVWRGDLLGPSPAVYHFAHAWLHLPPLAAGLLGLVPQDGEAGPRWTSDRGRLALAGLFAAGAAIGSAATVPAVVAIPTDAREAALVRLWRERLPEGAIVAHVERAERQILSLPIRGPRHRDLPLVCGEPVPDLSALGDEVFLYRAGLCSSPRGRACCEAVEARYELTPWASATLPAIESMGGLGYDTDPVEVGLYRVEGRRRDGP